MTDIEEDEEETYTPAARIEFTVGVKVPFAWNPTTKSYQLLRDEVETTTGGLFSDAEEGYWVPENDEWESTFEDNEDDASRVAWDFVRVAVTPS